MSITIPILPIANAHLMEHNYYSLKKKNSMPWRCETRKTTNTYKYTLPSQSPHHIDKCKCPTHHNLSIIVNYLKWTTSSKEKNEEMIMGNTCCWKKSGKWQIADGSQSRTRNHFRLVQQSIKQWSDSKALLLSLRSTSEQHKWDGEDA